MFQVQTTDDMWRYIEHTFVPSLIHGSTRYTADDATIVVGIARIRQLRVVVGRAHDISLCLQVAGGSGKKKSPQKHDAITLNAFWKSNAAFGLSFLLTLC